MIRVFCRKTSWTPRDPLAFVGDPPFPALLPKGNHVVSVSCTFTWDIPEALRLKRAWSRVYSQTYIGGPAFDSSGSDFEPGVFVKPGITITSRGCPNHCSFCLVPKREGPLRELPIVDGWNVADNNLLACSPDHIHQVFEMLRRQPEPIKFSGGLEARRFNKWHADLLKSIRLKFAWFACDSPAGLRYLEHARQFLDGFSREKLRCYVLIGWNGETIQEAEKHLESVYNLGFLPMAMLYRSPETNGSEWPGAWKALQKLWSRPAAYKAKMKHTPTVSKMEPVQSEDNK